MKRYILLFLVFSAFGMQAQTDSLRLSLNEAIESGLKARLDLKVDEASLDLSQNDVQARKNAWLPELNGAGVLRQNIQIQQAFIPAGFAGLPEPMMVKFGASNIAVFGLDLNQVVYNPSIPQDVKIAETQVALQREKNVQNQNAVKEKITQAYLNALLRRLQWEIVSENQTRYGEYLAVAEGKFNHGSLIENDLLKAKLDFENAKVETRKSLQNYEQALLMLAWQMNYSGSQPIALSDPLESLNLQSPESELEQALQTRSDFRTLGLQQRVNAQMLKRARNLSLPALSLFANYSQQFMSMKWDVGTGKWWTPYSYAGLRLSLPLSALYKDRTMIRGYNLKASQYALMLEQRRSDIRFQLRSASMDLENARINKEQAMDNYRLSQKIYATQKSQYSLGALPYASLLDTEKSLSLAEQNYIKSVFDWMVAQINYKKATGEF